MINKRFLEEEYYNEIVLQSDNFIVIPTLGAMVEGWLLIVPKEHVLSFGLITDKELHIELESLVKEVCLKVKAEYGSCIMFEHGAICENSLVGCGVDYAHLHIVPIVIDLIDQLSNEGFNYNWENAVNIHDSAKFALANKPYLFFSNNMGENYITTDNNIPSQLFRKIIAKNIGLDSLWDWKSNAFEENIYTTISKLKKIFTKEMSVQ